MTLKVFHYAEAKQGSPEALSSRLLKGIELSHGHTIPDSADFDILIAAFPTKDLVEASPNLKIVIIPFAGLPEPTRNLLFDYPHIAVHNTPYNHVATAETALALLLASSKFMVEGDTNLRRNDWTLRYSELPQLILQGRTLLLLGYGRIGKYIAPVCKALGMEVVGVKRSLQADDEMDTNATLHESKQLKALLPKADVLLISLPETPETVGLIGEEALNLLPKNAILVNVGRGSVIDETALFNALSNGRLAAAGLDVWFNYPGSLEERGQTAPSKYAFHELFNVVMSPHKAGWLGKEDESRMIFLAQMINTYAQGKAMPNLMNLERGY